MVFIRPPQGICLLPAGLTEDPFDADGRLGRVSILAALVNAVSTVNRRRPQIADPVLILSGPVTYWYGPGGGIPWEEISTVRIHPLNFRYVGFRFKPGSLDLPMDVFFRQS